MTLDELMILKKWTPLSHVVERQEKIAFLETYCFRMDNGLYVQLSKFKDADLATGPDAPYVTGVYFFPDKTAGHRVLKFAIEDDAGVKLSLPAVVLPDCGWLEYGAILACLKLMKPRVCMETGRYRIASDGKFVDRTIETERHTFYFRGMANDDRELPYAALYKLQS